MNNLTPGPFAHVPAVLGLLVLFNCVRADEPGKTNPDSKTVAVIDHDEFLLVHFKKPTDTASLLAFLNAPSDADLLEIPVLIGRLGDNAFAERQKASTKLIKIGLPALMPLRDAMHDADLERATLAKITLEKMDRSSSAVIVPAASIRLLMKRKPPELLEALLHYLPFTTDPQVEEEIYYDVKDLAVAGGSIHPAVLKALNDRLPARRAVAGCITARYGAGDDRKKASGLLTDADAYVRLRTAQGFLAAQDVSAVPTLIDLLTCNSITFAWQAEELLHWLADGSGPSEVVDNGSDAAKKACAAWRKWWQQHRQMRIDADSAGKRLKPCFYFSTYHTEAKMAGSDLSVRWSLRPARALGDFEPLAMTHNGRLLALASAPPVGDVTGWGKPFSIGEYDSSSGKLLNSLYSQERQISSLESMANGCVLMNGGLQLCDNFLAVQDLRAEFGRFYKNRCKLGKPCGLDSGILIMDEMTQPAIWHLDPGAAQVIRQFPHTSSMERAHSSFVVDATHCVLVDRHRNIVLHDYQADRSVDLKIKVPDSIDLGRCALASFRDGSLIFRKPGATVIAEIDLAAKQALVKDFRTRGLLWQSVATFTLVRFGF